MMKMNLFRHYVPLALLSGGLLLSCSHDEFSSGSGVIDFSTASNRFSTKVAPMVSDDMRTFRVWSYSSMNDGFVPNLDGAEVSRASAADDWVYSPMGEWPPEGAVDFYAVSPADAVAQDDMTPAYNYATFTYTVPAADDQVDLLVVKKSAVDVTAHPSPVQLTFAHALSRIGLNVKTNAAGAVFKIEDVKLLNVNSTGTYSFIDGTWSDLTGLTSYNVSVDASWKNGKVLTTADSIVIGGDNGLMILPQTAVPGTYQVDVTAPTNGTYLSLKATLVKEGENGEDVEHTFYFPVVDNLDDRNPLEFEKSKQYTFNLELQAGSGFNAFQITFSGVTSEAWENGEGALDTQGRVWSKSNIYFSPDLNADPDGNIGSLTFSEDDPSKSGYQGLYFKWGSLIGVSPASDHFGSDLTFIYIPDLTTGASEGKYYKVQSSLVSPSYSSGSSSDISLAVRAYATKQTNGYWSNIPYDNTFYNTFYISGRDLSPLTDYHSTLVSNYKGDICKFLSDKKDTNGSGLTRNWVMPVSNDFGSDWDYTKSSSWDNMVTTSITPENGTSIIPNAYYIYTTASDVDVTFPASGCRNYDNGALDSVGNSGNYWSSSAGNVSIVYFLYFSSDNGMASDYGNVYRAYGQSVRCVRN